DALPIRVIVHRRGLLIARRSEALLQRLDIVHLVSEMVYAWHTGIGLPAFLRLNAGLSQGDIRVVGSDMHPPRAASLSGIEAYSESGKCRLQEADRGVNVPHEQVSVFKSNFHK